MRNVKVLLSVYCLIAFSGCASKDSDLLAADNEALKLKASPLAAEPFSIKWTVELPPPGYGTWTIGEEVSGQPRTAGFSIASRQIGESPDSEAKHCLIETAAFDDNGTHMVYSGKCDPGENPADAEAFALNGKINYTNPRGVFTSQNTCIIKPDDFKNGTATCQSESIFAGTMDVNGKLNEPTSTLIGKSLPIAQTKTDANRDPTKQASEWWSDFLEVKLYEHANGDLKEITDTATCTTGRFNQGSDFFNFDCGLFAVDTSNPNLTFTVTANIRYETENHVTACAGEIELVDKDSPVLEGDHTTRVIVPADCGLAVYPSNNLYLPLISKQ